MMVLGHSSATSGYTCQHGGRPSPWIHNTATTAPACQILDRVKAQEHPRPMGISKATHPCDLTPWPFRQPAVGLADEDSATLYRASDAPMQSSPSNHGGHTGSSGLGIGVGIESNTLHDPRSAEGAITHPVKTHAKAHHCQTPLPTSSKNNLNIPVCKTNR